MQAAPFAAVWGAAPVLAQAAWWYYKKYQHKRKYLYGSKPMRRKGTISMPLIGKRRRVNFDGYSAGGIDDPSEGDQGGYNQETRISLRTGRQVTKGHINRVLNKSDLLSRTLFWKRLPINFIGISGQYPLLYNSSTLVTPGTSDKLPLYMFNLTRLQLAGTGASAAYRLCIDKTSGLFNWTPYNSFSNTGTDTAYPQVLRDATDFPSTAQKELYWGNVNLKMVLYGATNKNTTYDLMLVSFENENIAVSNDTNQLNGGGTTGTGLEHQTFWQEMVKDYIAHPCAIQGPSYGQASKMKILRKARYSIGPTATTETDVNPHHVIVNWFHGINKRINMRYSGTVSATPANVLAQLENADANYVDSSGLGGVLQETPQVKDRVYLLIRASDYTKDNVDETLVTKTNGGTTAVNSAGGSFDLSYTTSYYVTI